MHDSSTIWACNYLASAISVKLEPSNLVLSTWRITRSRKPNRYNYFITSLRIHDILVELTLGTIEGSPEIITDNIRYVEGYMAVMVFRFDIFENLVNHKCFEENTFEEYSIA